MDDVTKNSGVDFSKHRKVLLKGGEHEAKRLFRQGKLERYTLEDHKYYGVFTKAFEAELNAKKVPEKKTVPASKKKERS